MDNSIQILKKQFHMLLQSQRLGCAHLLECPVNKPVDEVICRIISLSLCSSMSHCGCCQSCSLLANDRHPDLRRLPNSQQTVKVADIRGLTDFIYQAPKVARFRIIVIKAADLLNRSAANALLKMLEEPPQHVVFILSCENASNVIPTIRSRAAHWQISIALASDNDWKVLSKWLINDEGKKQLLEDKPILIAQMNTVYERKEQPFEVAQSWQKYPIYDLLWFLYLLHAWALRQNHCDSIQKSYFGNNALLLQQIHRINAMIKLVRQGVALNHTLMCETLLMACKGTCNE